MNNVQKEYWASIYHACRLFEDGLNFDVFVQSPQHWLHLHGQEQAPQSMANGYQPLLPKQAVIARQIREQERTQDARRSQLRHHTPGHNVADIAAGVAHS